MAAGDAVSGRDTLTTCPYCGVGCGVRVAVGDDGLVAVHGDKSHPANFGRLCSKGTALGETVDHEGRLLHPQIGDQRVDWDTALDAVSRRFREIIDTHGPDAVAFYVSGQLLTEDYYVANKLMKGRIGSANIDTNSRLCMSSAVAAYKRAFGSDTVPTAYEDLEYADLIVLVGSNLAWCHPVLFQRIVMARKARPDLKVIVVDPRRTDSCDAAHMHLALRSGTDAVLFNGLLHWLSEHGKVDTAFVGGCTQGVDDAVNTARWHAGSVDSVAEKCGLSVEAVTAFYRLFGETERVVTVFSQGVNQSSSGTDKGNSIINCHLLTGRLGRRGCGPFSITGQPNAMGGREVGGLANQLAAHMDLDDAAHRDIVSRFWQATSLPDSPGLKAVDLFHAVEAGQVKAIWIMATNPAVSLPDSSQVRRALSACDCVVVSDCVAHNDTLAHADIRLPALAWGEKDGTVTNSERCISRQRAFLPEPGEARADWWIIAEVARRMGYDGFDYASAAEIFDEHARLSCFENAGSRDFDLSGLVGLGAAGFDALQPVQWPVHPGGGGTLRMLSDGHFFTPTGRANFVAVTPRPPARFPDQAYPLVLNTGRIRDQWHTMTRTGKSPRLGGHISEPFVAMHPDDAAESGIRDRELATMVSEHGEVILRVDLTEAQPRGQVFSPIHWNDQFAAAARIGSLIDPAVDPVSGQPEFKHTPVRVIPYRAAWHGFLLTRREMTPRHATYWSKARRQGLWHYELAGELAPDDWATCMREQIGSDADAAEWRELYDSTQANYRAARICNGRLDLVVIIGPDYHLPPRDWLVALFKQDALADDERARLLRGTPPNGEQDAGAVVCSCFSVGINTLTRAIERDGLDTPEAIGRALNAGTNCGSCVPELRRLIAETSREPSSTY